MSKNSNCRQIHLFYALLREMPGYKMEVHKGGGLSKLGRVLCFDGLQELDYNFYLASLGIFCMKRECSVGVPIVKTICKMVNILATIEFSHMDSLTT